MLESSNARAAMLAASIVAFAAGNDGGSSPALKPRLVPAPLTMSAAE
jgi:hypothetical protein